MSADLLVFIAHPTTGDHNAFEEWERLVVAHHQFLQKGRSLRVCQAEYVIEHQRRHPTMHKSLRSLVGQAERAGRPDSAVRQSLHIQGRCEGIASPTDRVTELHGSSVLLERRFDAVEFVGYRDQGGIVLVHPQEKVSQSPQSVRRVVDR
ncbi:hypothetical protein KYT97_14170 [Rhodococcus globerulus]|nr:hypothetical protein [Rhodococcus globerulus]QXW05049.1 hypothetical protein KYT97_14170 [Rhodococcus globerulus]